MGDVRKRHETSFRKFQALPTLSFREEIVWDPLDYLCEEEEEREYCDPSVLTDMVQEADKLLQKYNLPVGPITGKIQGMEVGDDRVDISRGNPFPLALALVVQERVVGMKTSWNDTFISKHMWNFCEVTSVCPSMPDGSFDMARKTGQFSKLEFTDTVPLRIVLDVSKADRSHSSTAIGKAAMLGARLSTPRTELRSRLMLASFLQDGLLRTSRSSDPKYLPRIMGGSGVRPLYDNFRNLFLYTRAYRGGGYDRLYGTATEEIRNCLSQLERGNPVSPSLCFRLRDRQEYLYGTYKEYVLIPPTPREGIRSEELPQPLYLEQGPENRFKSFENRLLRSRLIVGRADAEREWERTQRVQSILREGDPVLEIQERERSKSLLIRTEFGLSLNANSQFRALLDRMANWSDVEKLIAQGWKPSTSGRTAFTLLDALWIFEGCKSETYTVEDLTRNEDIFVREEVSVEESFKVGGIHLLPVARRGILPQRTVSKVGLYQINNSMLEWSEDLLRRLKNVRDHQPMVTSNDLIREFNLNREWVNDDSGLIGLAIVDYAGATRSDMAILVSSDRRLANQMSNQANIRVLRLEPKPLILLVPKEALNSQTVWTVEELVPYLGYFSNMISKWTKVYVDTGSLSAAASRLEVGTDSFHNRVIYRREILNYTRPEDGVRQVAYNLYKEGIGRLQMELKEPIFKQYRTRADRPLSYTLSATEGFSPYRRQSYTG